MATLLHKNFCPGDHESYNFVRPFLGHHYYQNSLFDLCLGVKKRYYMYNAFSLCIYMTYMT